MAAYRGSRRMLLYALALLMVIGMTQPAQASALTDLDGHWASQYLTEAVAVGLVRGYPDGAVRPDAIVSRAELVAMVCRMLGEEENAAAASRLLPVYDDVQSEHWAVGYFRVGTEIGLVKGDGDGHAYPDTPILRMELATIAARACGLLQIQGQVSKRMDFRDLDQVPEWAKSDVAYVAGLGLIRGDENGDLRPLEGTTRAEAAVVVLRLLEGQGSRWDVVGNVESVDPETGALRIVIAGNVVNLRVDGKTRLFRDGAASYLSLIRTGESIKVTFDRRTAGLAAVIALGQP